MAKIVRASLTDQIFDYIKEKITSGEWASGQKLPSETELSETLGVSRMSLRSAIQKANVLGLTETQVGEGTFVKDFSMASYFKELYSSNILSRDYNEINDFRMLLQIGSVRLAFEKPTLTEDLHELENIYGEMEKVAERQDISTFHKLDNQFHHCVIKLCNNELMLMLYNALEDSLNEVTARNVERSIEEYGGYDYILNFHRTLLSAIQEKDIQKFIDAEMSSRARSYRYYAKATKQELAHLK